MATTQFVLELNCYLGGATTAASHTVAGSGTQSWTMAAGAPMPLEGMWLRFEVNGTPGTYMEGPVVAADSTTRVVTLDIRASAGSGSFAGWIASYGLLRFSTHPYATLPGESPANVPFMARIQQAGEINRSMFDNGATGGASRIEVGQIVLSNADGFLDPLLDYGLDGRACSILVGEYREELGERVSYPGGFTTVLAGTCTSGMASAKDFTLGLRTRQFDVQQPYPKNSYAGSNSLPNGLEGVADDLKGKPKPKLFGYGTNISPPCVNTSRLEYQVSDGAVDAITAVYDSGVALTPGTAYTSQADMETNAPAASGFRVWLAGGYFRVGSTPAGVITCDAYEGSNPSTRKAAAIINRITLDVAGFYAMTFADNIALGTAATAELELWISESTTVAEVLDKVCNSVGAWWGFDRTGQFRVKRLDAPTGLSQVLTFRVASRDNPLATGEADILDLEVLAPQDQSGGHGWPRKAGPPPRPRTPPPPPCTRCPNR
jgi:hypothetical protein